MSLLEISSPTLAVSVSNVSALAVTVTESLADPTARDISVRMV